ncbi:DNA polymerase [Bat mastadenovirus]|uniref:DNA polymerase n=1 Tax=Bat mastadenovirus TaxID=740971 RepID=A0A3G9EDU6_9ADEN|nr:DNA polymerase [Bat mastadenovirus]BBE29304.1 DNA polymerase [Bat mastadenovirus]
MSLVQGDRTGGFLSEQTNSDNQPESGGAGFPAQVESQASAGTPRPCPAPLKRKYKGTVVTRRATLSISAILDDGQPIEIKYHSDLPSALTSLCNAHLYDLPSCLASQITPANLPAIIEQAAAPLSVICYYKRGTVRQVMFNAESPVLSFPLRFLVKQGKVYLIKDIASTNKCEFCGSFYKVTHTCTLRRRDFYFHQVAAHSADWWEKIAFTPIGSPPSTERLFIVYDVETYTWHGKFGKQLVPFMLVFQLVGDHHLVAEAIKLAQEQEWDTWGGYDNIFYCVTPEKRAIGLKFKKFRDTLQQQLANTVWAHVLGQNPHLHQEAINKGLSNSEELTPADLKKCKLNGHPRFLEVYAVGHNITGFDEILLAAQVVSTRAVIPPVFEISRNFMPRAGRLLFNDVTYSLPNPAYVSQRVYENWEKGQLRETDLKNQYIKFMVRDTFTLTHTSLKNAAKAYSLSVAKGSCPYQAVNEFYMLGTYQQDDSGFPAKKYWRDEEEYQLNRDIWLSKKKGAYDIIQETLDYCALDVQVTTQLVEKLIESYQQFIETSVGLPDTYFNVFQRPTISSNSHAVFKQIMYRAEKPQQNNLGNTLLAPSNEMYDYVRSSIRGGRCYPTYIGVLSEPVFVYDICGMYASALTHPFPAGPPLNPYERALAVRAYEVKMQSQSNVSYFDPDLLPGIFTIDADPPDDVFLDVLPPFCSRKGGRLCWTNEPLRGEIATSIDVVTLHNRGWKVKIIPDARTTVFPEWKCLAREYVQLNINAKEKADREKNQTMRSIAKLLSNALYGSFATKLDNKKTVFSDQIEPTTAKEIASGEYVVKSSSYIETDNLCAEIMPEFVVAYPPPPAIADPSAEGHTIQEKTTDPPFISNQGVTSYTYKPIMFIDAEDDDFCLHTLEKSSPLIVNNRYPSQIASFVLAWTRAFVSEWAQYLYQTDAGIPLEKRLLKSVYGDTDSLFTTFEGYKLMEEKGKKRLKRNGGNLVFDPANPELTWLVECETQCEKCGSDAFSSESVYLAPKLYALRDTTCTKCGHVGKGKLRAKGHATSSLNYNMLKDCYLADLQQGSDIFSTSRMSLRRTITSVQAHVQPFTVTETTLKRTLRPWKDKTLHALDTNRLIPYSRKHPNPRNTETTWMDLPWMN